MPIPTDIEEILASQGSEGQRVKKYIESLHAEIEKLGGDVDVDEKMDDDEPAMETEDVVEDDGFTVPQYESGEDYENQSELKMKAADSKNAGNLEDALESYNGAVTAAPPSALLLSNRAIVLEKLGHYKAAELDCKLALEQNPDSAKALKTRGKLRFEHLNDWEGALGDLGSAQSIDFDPEIADILKELTKKRIEKEKEEAHERIEKENKLRKKAEDIKKAREEARQEAEEEARASMGGGMPGGGMPGGGMPGGGMPGGGMGAMPGMAEAMNDPEIQEAMKNPKVMAAFKELSSGPGGPMGLMSNPGKLQEMMGDPDVGPFMNLLMKKMMGGGGMPGMGGMGGGGMPGMGGDYDADDGDDIPDLDDMPDLE